MITIMIFLTTLNGFLTVSISVSLLIICLSTCHQDEDSHYICI